MSFRTPSKVAKAKLAKENRLKSANALLAVIAGLGRKFFAHGPKIASFELDERGRIWFIDDYSGARIYTHKSDGRWKGFSHGGTMRSLILALRDHINSGEPMRGHLGPWAQWTCDGDLWGYGFENMEQIRAAAVRLNIAAKPASPASPPTTSSEGAAVEPPVSQLPANASQSLSI